MIHLPPKNNHHCGHLNQNIDKKLVHSNTGFEHKKTVKEEFAVEREELLGHRQVSALWFPQSHDMYVKD